ncbi:MAG: hypothetical protein LC437_07470 [Thiohalomonas sp.]|nr:hypothetical protein [Thiohalomonas sp.]
MVANCYSSDLGQALLSSEKYHLNKRLEQIYGYNLLQLGCLDEFELSKKSRTLYQYVLESSGSIKQQAQVYQKKPVLMLLLVLITWAYKTSLLMWSF